MLLETFPEFTDFELLDTGNGQRLERWGNFRLIRPDPQIIWTPSLPEKEWHADAIYKHRGDRGAWEKTGTIPNSWLIHYNDVALVAKLSPFKHTGIFAEQAANWSWMIKQLPKNSKPLKFLNLFGYTGGATMVLTKQGHHVTHVDASKPALAWAKENQSANNFKSDSIRWILDDAAKFAKRELRRGQTYDGIIMDPPAFGHSPTGATWKFNRDLPGLLRDCVQLLSPHSRFLLINGYATNSSAMALHNILEDVMTNTKHGGTHEYGELCLKQKTDRLISTGIFARWKK